MTTKFQPPPFGVVDEVYRSFGNSHPHQATVSTQSGERPKTFIAATDGRPIKVGDLVWLGAGDVVHPMAREEDDGTVKYVDGQTGALSSHEITNLKEKPVIICEPKQQENEYAGWVSEVTREGVTVHSPPTSFGHEYRIYQQPRSPLTARHTGTKVYLNSQGALTLRPYGSPGLMSGQAPEDNDLSPVVFDKALGAVRAFGKTVSTAAAVLNGEVAAQLNIPLEQPNCKCVAHKAKKPPPDVCYYSTPRRIKEIKPEYFNDAPWRDMQGEVISTRIIEHRREEARNEALQRRVQIGVGKIPFCWKHNAPVEIDIYTHEYDGFGISSQRRRSVKSPFFVCPECNEEKAEYNDE